MIGFDYEKCKDDCQWLCGYGIPRDYDCHLVVMMGVC